MTRNEHAITATRAGGAIPSELRAGARAMRAGALRARRPSGAGSASGWVVLASLAAVSCGAAKTGRARGDGDAGPERGRGGEPAGSLFALESEAFSNGGTIPARHTADGADVSPPLAWRNPPEGAVAFALVLDDRDAPGGSFVHWLVYDLPGSARALPEAVPPGRAIEGGGRQGDNGWGTAGYQGPDPPSGDGDHRYLFSLHALTAPLGLPGGADHGDFERALSGRTLGAAHLTGRFGR